MTIEVNGIPADAGQQAQIRAGIGAPPVDSPAFTGTPTAPTAAGGTNTTQLATTAFVKAAIDALLSGAPGALDTLNELAAALGNDANFAATVTSALAGKQPLDADLTAIAALSTTAFGRAILTWADAAAGRTALDAAALASPAFTGTPTAPTATPGDNSTKLATTAYADAAAAAAGGMPAWATPITAGTYNLNGTDFAVPFNQPCVVTGVTGFTGRKRWLLYNNSNGNLEFQPGGGATATPVGPYIVGPGEQLIVELSHVTNQYSVSVGFNLNDPFADLTAANAFASANPTLMVTNVTRCWVGFQQYGWNGSAWTPIGSSDVVASYDTLALAVAAYPHGSAALFALAPGARIFCREFIAGSGLGGFITRNYAASQAACKWTGRLRAWSEAPTNLNVAYPLTGTTASATASSDAGATTTVTHTGHGLPNVTGKNVYITGGTGWTVGFVGYTYIDANSYKLAVAYNANVPTLRTANGAANPTTFRTITIPAGVMHATAGFDLFTDWSFTGSTNNKYQKIDYGAAMGMLNANAASASDISLADERKLRHRGSLSSQVCQSNVSGQSYARSSGLPTTGTENSANAQDIKIYTDIPVGGTYVGVEMIELELVL